LESINEKNVGSAEQQAVSTALGIPIYAKAKNRSRQQHASNQETSVSNKDGEQGDGLHRTDCHHVIVLLHKREILWRLGSKKEKLYDRNCSSVFDSEQHDVSS
jgi:hypothetical protein